MNTTMFKVLTFFALAALLQPASAVVIDLKSGNGAVGGADSEITMLVGPLDTGFASAFTPGDFAAARAGSAAQIISRHPFWLDPSAFNGDTSAQWISDTQSGASQGSTVLYAIDFNLAFGAILTGSLDFYWSVDNVLGSVVNPAGIFLNGVAVPGVGGGSFGLNAPVLGVDVASLLLPGLNTLYINAVDVGGPGGLLFSALLDVTGGPAGVPPMTGVPAPATLVLMALGMLIMGRRRIAQL